MSIEGSISVAVDFNDTSDGDGVDTLKKIRLAATDAYTAGKVAVLSGTVSTTLVELSGSPSSYEDAAGNAVAFTSGITRIAFSSDAAAVVQAESPSLGGGGSDSMVRLFASNGRVSVADTYSVIQAVSVKAMVDKTTAAYTLVLYGS